MNSKASLTLGESKSKRHIEVDTLVFAHLLKLGLLVRLAQLFLALGLLLSTSNEELASLVVGIVESFDSFVGLLVGLEVDETETTALPLVIDLNDGRGNVAELLEERHELILSDLRVEVLDVNVGELSLHLLDLGLTLLW